MIHSHIRLLLHEIDACESSIIFQSKKAVVSFSRTLILPGDVNRTRTGNLTL